MNAELGKFFTIMGSVYAEYPNFNLVHLGQTMRKFPDARWTDALSRGQIESKIWLVNELSRHINDGLFYILGGWYGVLPYLMFQSGKFGDIRIRSFDIDEKCAPIAERLNLQYFVDDWRFKAATRDMYDMSYDPCHNDVKRANGTTAHLIEHPDVIINTSCEHLADFQAWWDRVPPGKMVALQSNNFFGWPEHVNCVYDLDDFIRQTALSTIFCAGECVFDHYERFMVIGKK